MADLFKSLKPSAHVSKNGFDLSRKHVFSSKAGQALPVLALETVPGDHHEIDLVSLTRTRTMNTAAFLRGKMRYDFFFVPNSQTWHPFNQFISQRTDKHSVLQKGHLYCPTVSYVVLLTHIWNEIKYNTNDNQGFRFAHGMVRVLDLLGYGDFRWLFDIQSDSDFQTHVAVYANKFVNVFRLAAYQHIWYDYYRNKFYDTVETGGINALSPELIPADYIYGFNFDSLSCDSFAHSNLPQGSFNQYGQPDNDAIILRMLLKMNYIQWKKDLFTSALPSQQFGAVSSVDLSGVNIVNDSVTPSFAVGLDYTSKSLNLKETATVKDTLSQNVTVQTSKNISNSDSWSIPSAFDVLSLRKAEALQSWKQATLRAGNMVDDSFEAHFGVKPYYADNDNVHYLGSFSGAIQVNSVEATAATGGDNGAVGDLAATGTLSVQGNKVQFDAKDFGVVMCIASFLPESEYSSNAIDKANTLYEQFDFYTPEFANIGLEAVTKKEIMFAQDPNDLNDVIGYAPRYYMYKQALDKVFGAFKDTESCHSGLQPATANGSYEAWVAPRTEYFVNSYARAMATFYVSPSVLDNIFGVTADSTQETDQFINNVYFDIKSIRPMSVLGLPQF